MGTGGGGPSIFGTGTTATLNNFVGTTLRGSDGQAGAGSGGASGYGVRSVRALTVVDACTREALVIEVDSGLKGEQVFEAVSRITAVRGAPRSIRVYNGPEFGVVVMTGSLSSE